MSQALASKLADEPIGPVQGQISVLVANVTAQIVDLCTLGPGAADMRNADAFPVSSGFVPPGTTGQQTAGTQTGLLGRFVEFAADAIDIGVIFAANAAMLAGANAANLAAVGVNGAGCCLRIPGGVAAYRTFLIHPSTRFLSYIAANTTSNLRIVATSRTG